MSNTTKRSVHLLPITPLDAPASRLCLAGSVSMPDYALLSQDMSRYTFELRLFDARGTLLGKQPVQLSARARPSPGPTVSAAPS